LLKVYRESMEYLESISALELMSKMGLFMRDLNKLVNGTRLPAAVIIGCLMQEVHRLTAKSDEILLDDKLTRSFRLVKRYMDEKFMKKE